jgi:hypothetical protein
VEHQATRGGGMVSKCWVDLAIGGGAPSNEVIVGHGLYPQGAVPCVTLGRKKEERWKKRGEEKEER